MASVTLAANGGVLSSRGGITAQKASPGNGRYCFGLPFTPAGGAVTLSQANPGFPVAFINFDATILAGDCNAGFRAAEVFTYNQAGGAVTDEIFSAVFY